MQPPEIQLSVVIPVFNMGRFLPDLIASLQTSGVFALSSEVVLVDDGSTDNTASVTVELSQKFQKVRLYSIGKNMGRYQARLLGAKEARTSHVLFLDARLILADDFGVKIREHWATSDFLGPQARIDTKRSLFCLYWDRSHRAIFKSHYSELEKGPQNLTIKNFESFLKGTTAILVPRQLFLDTCDQVGPTLLSDDTALIRLMVETKPLRLCPDLWFWWTPRETWKAFLWRLYDRGPGLVEYHVFTRRGWIFQAIVAGLFGLSILAWSFLIDPEDFFEILGLVLLLAALSTRWVARSWVEAIKLAPLHVAVLGAVGLGILRGLWVNARRWHKGELRWIAE